MKYFKLSEFSNSFIAKKNNIKNDIPSQYVQNIVSLVDNVLDPLREEWGDPIVVTSGYRCLALNKIVKGSDTSQHLTGQAADITAGNMVKNKILFKVLVRQDNFDQVILEYGGQWIHVSYKNEKSNRHEILKTTGNKKYTKLTKEQVL